jgi:V8-like Glu-specific endopeptidase
MERDVPQSLGDLYSGSELIDELHARQHRTDALPHRSAELEQVDTGLLIEAVTRAPRAIYGPDNRVDLYQVTDPRILRLAESVVLVADKTVLTEQPDKSYKMTTVSLQTFRNLCNGQTFGNQQRPAVGCCTGFFITPTCIITAGHCVDGKTIRDMRFVTGFRMVDPVTAVTTFTPRQIFAGVRLLRSRFRANSRDAADYAVVEVACLDGRSTGTPVSISPTASVFARDSVFVIGHPSSLPAKFAPNSTVRDVSAQSYFVANLDTFGGNSGSPVFDVTNAVVGILVRGDTDYVATPAGCNVVSQCPNSGCRGEDVQRITGVVGPVRDLSLQLDIGNNGLWSRRDVKVRFNGKAGYTLLPDQFFDPWKSYTFKLKPGDMRIGSIDDIDLIEIFSPALDNPISWDEWDLARAIVHVNGGQELYNVVANHTFYDIHNDPSLTWLHSIATLPEKPMLSSIVFGYGSTPSGTTNWQQYNNDPNSLFVDVDTTDIGYPAPPLYFPSLAGNGGHWLAQGAGAVYSATAKGFRVYLHYPSPVTPAQANAQAWRINWFGYLQLSEGNAGMNMFSGSTPAGKTNWQQYNNDPNSLYVDIDTSAATFSTAPLYYTSLGGDGSHWLAQGVNAVYDVTEKGFRIYLHYPTAVTPAQANQWNWHINWVGIES